MDRRFSTLFGTIAIVVATGAICPLFGAFDGVAVSASPVTFRAYVTDGDMYALTNADDVAAWPVTWRTGETVDATAMDGTEYVLSDFGGGTLSSTTLPEKGGVWSLVNSEEGSARVLVPWSVYQGDGVSLATGVMGEAFAGDTQQNGPNRKGDDRHFPPISWSGDDWAGDASATSTLTITPPAGGGAPTVFADLDGEGFLPFSFDKVGTWTVSLAMSDGTIRTAFIGRSGGFVFVVR